MTYSVEFGRARNKTAIDFDWSWVPLTTEQPSDEYDSLWIVRNIHWRVDYRERFDELLERVHQDQWTKIVDRDLGAVHLVYYRRDGDAAPGSAGGREAASDPDRG